MKVLLVLILVSTFQIYLVVDASDPANRNPARLRSSLFEPLFSYDDIDAHTVSAGFQEPVKPKQSPPVAPAARTTDLSRSSASTDRGSSTSARSTTLPTTTSRLIQSGAPILIQSSLPVRQSGSQVRVTKRTEPTQPAQHWSGLQNYYQKLLDQQQQLLPKQPQAQTQQQLTDGYPNQLSQQFLSTIFERYREEERLRPLGYQVPYSRAQSPAYMGSQPAFALPLDQATLLNAPAFARSSAGQQKVVDYPDITIYPPSRKITTSPASGFIGSTSASTNVQQKPIDEGADLSRRRDYDRYFFAYPSSSSDSSPSARINYNQNLEMRRLPDLLLLDLHNNRLKHQQETFGSWYNPQQLREQVREEVYCSKQNQVLSQYSKSPSSPIVIPSDFAKGQSRFLYDTQVRLNSQLESLDESSASSGPNEYPAHIGIYNGSEKIHENFLCSATWIHESYALTVASCFRSVPDIKNLVIRLGEWNLNKNGTQGLERDFITRQVKQVHQFYKFRNDSLEHNLALVEFDKPVEVFEAPLLGPACQVQPRMLMKTNSCWTPIRNITSIEYFDPDGEGETKERKHVDMKETSVKLYANNDAECAKHTGIESFNYRYPNYICSDSYKTAKWRNSLNQSGNFGAGIYCNENGQYNLVSVVHPVNSNSSSMLGYTDLTYYKPWIRNVIYGRIL